MRRSSRTRSRAALLLGTLLITFMPAPSAIAAHQAFSFGADCQAQVKQAEAQVGSAKFSACFGQNGQPLANYQAFYDLVDPNGQQRQMVPMPLTDAQGQTMFEVPFDFPGNWTVILCDDQQGCHDEIQVQVVEAEPEQPGPGGRIVPLPEQEALWQFFDYRTGETVSELPYGTDAEIILAHSSFDISELLPITFQILVAGELVYEETASDPNSQCRDTHHCSVPAPRLDDPGQGVVVEIVALTSDGEVIAICRQIGGDSVAVPFDVTGEATSEPSPVCWWCWGLKLFFVVSLIWILFVHVIKQEWWSWWALWFILIFVWVPVFLGWFWFFGGGWFWIVNVVWVLGILLAALWAGRATWWKPWMWVFVLAWLALIALEYLVGLPLRGVWRVVGLFWLPWLAFWLLVRGMRRPWWKWWLALPLFGYLAWVVWWIGWLGPFWAWVIPALVIPVFGGWYLLWKGKGRSEWWGPKICFVLSWALFPWLAFMNTLWDPWWCWVVIAFIVLSMICMIFHFVRKTQWWVWWALWFILIFFWIPLLLGVVLFFAPWWWWIPLALWGPVVLIAALTCSRKPWWKAWWWLLALAWLTSLAAGMALWGATWWFVVPGFWLPWVAIWVFGRAMGRPWWKAWLWLPLLGWIGWVFAWVIFLGPTWWWVFAVAIAPSLLLWFVVLTKQTTTVVMQKLCFILPWCMVPLFAFAVLIYYYDLPVRTHGTPLTSKELTEPIHRIQDQAPEWEVE